MTRVARPTLKISRSPELMSSYPLVAPTGMAAKATFGGSPRGSNLVLRHECQRERQRVTEQVNDSRRTREIGVRIALGAQRQGVFKMVLREALSLALIGALLGLPLALGVGKLVEAQLYGVPAIDPAVTVGATLALLAASALAGYLPARRAMQISPVQALRHD